MNNSFVKVKFEDICRIKFQWTAEIKRRGRGFRDVVIEQKNGEMVYIHSIQFDDVLMMLSETARRYNIQLEGLEVIKSGYTYKYACNLQTFGGCCVLTVSIYLLGKSLKLF